ncbi:MAG: MFS transporter, partial [Anaerolineae bacterium]|nr:MFS transporter [Anaerolineae bacterium]
MTFEIPISPEPVTSINDRKIANTAGYYLAFIVLGLATAVLGPTLTGLAAQTHTEIGAISFLFTTSSLGYLLGSLIGGQLYDRMPGHPLVAGMLVGLAATLALIPLVPWLLVLSLLTMLLGLGQGIVDVGCNTLLVWVHQDKVAPYMNGLHFFFGVGASASPIIIAQAISLSGGIAWGYWILALMAAPISLWLLRLPSPSARTFTPEERGARRPDYRLVVLAALLLFLYVGAEIAFGGWIFTYAVAHKLVTETGGAYLTSLFWGAFTLGRLVSIPLAARVRPRLILLGDLLGCLVSLGIILVWAESAAALWIGTVGLGLAMASVFPTVINLAERRMNLTAQIMSWFFVGGSLGSSLLPWLIGQLFEGIGPHVVMIVILADLVVMLGVFLVTISY